jgi:hypothetical protein
MPEPECKLCKIIIDQRLSGWKENARLPHRLELRSLLKALEKQQQALDQSTVFYDQVTEIIQAVESVRHEKLDALAAKRLRRAALTESKPRRTPLQDGIPATCATFSGYELSPPPVIPTPAMNSGNMEARLGQGEHHQVSQLLFGLADLLPIVNVDQMRPDGQDGSSGSMSRDTQAGPGLEQYQGNKSAGNRIVGLSTVSTMQPVVCRGPPAQISSSNDATKRTYITPEQVQKYHVVPSSIYDLRFLEEQASTEEL